MNVAAALAAETVQSDRKCKLQLILDDIPPDTPNLDSLLEGLFGKRRWAALDAAVRMSAGGAPVSDKVIREHRNGRCLCFR